MAVLGQTYRKWQKLTQTALAVYGVSPAQASVLISVGSSDGGIKQSALATHLGIKGQSLVRLLDRLSTVGLLVRKDDPNDRRPNLIWLTGEGQNLTHKIKNVLDHLEWNVIGNVEPEAIQAVSRIADAVEYAAMIGETQPDLCLIDSN